VKLPGPPLLLGLGDERADGELCQRDRTDERLGGQTAGVELSDVDDGVGNILAVAGNTLRRAYRDRSGQQVPKMPSRGHRVNHHLVAGLKDEHDGLKEAPVGVEAEAELAARPVILVIQWLDPQRPVGSLQRIFLADPMLGRSGESSRRKVRKRATDCLRAADLLSVSHDIQGRQFVNGEPNRHDLHGLGASTGAAPTATLELLDVVTSLSLVGPLLDLFLGDLVLPHENIVNENGRAREGF
jgi:hypothetical protein